MHGIRDLKKGLLKNSYLEQRSERKVKTQLGRLKEQENIQSLDVLAETELLEYRWENRKTEQRTKRYILFPTVATSCSVCSMLSKKENIILKGNAKQY